MKQRPAHFQRLSGWLQAIDFCCGAPSRLALACLVLTLSAGCQPEPAETSATKSISEEPRGVYAIGKLKPAGDVIEVSAIPGERLLRYSDGVVENKTVAGGSELAVLASYELRDKHVEMLEKKLQFAASKHKQDLLAAEIQIQRATAALAEAKAKQKEILAKEGQLAALAEASSIALVDIQILTDLQQQDAELISDHELRRKRNDAARAKSEYKALSSTLPDAKAATQAAVDAAQATLNVAQEQLKQLRVNDPSRLVQLEQGIALETREQSVLYAPGDVDSPRLTILKKHAEPGEFVTQLPVLQVADLSHMVCIAEVYEGDRNQIEVGQRVTMTSSSFGNELKEGIPGIVRRIGNLIGNPGLINRNPLAPSDRSVIEVLIDFAPLDADGNVDQRRLAILTKQAAARVGLQVTVEFTPRKNGKRETISEEHVAAGQTPAQNSEARAENSTTVEQSIAGRVGSQANQTADLSAPTATH